MSRGDKWERQLWWGVVLLCSIGGVVLNGLIIGAEVCLRQMMFRPTTMSKLIPFIHGAVVLVILTVFLAAMIRQRRGWSK